MRLRLGFTAEASLTDTKDQYIQGLKSYEHKETIIPAAPYYGSPRKEHCTTLRTRQWSAILHGITSGSWERACAITPNTIEGQYFPRATRCVNTGLNMWGQFDVNDSSCDTSSHSYNGPCGTTVPGGRSCVSGWDPYSRQTLSRCCLPGPRWAWIKVYQNRPHESGCGFPCVF